MGGQLDLELKTLKFIYSRNKQYIASLSVLFICILLFLQFIVPQFQMIFTAKEQAKEDLLQLSALKENLRILSSIDESSLDSQMNILNRALPSDKDFDGILNSINSSARNASANLGTFSFQVGSLSESAGIDRFPSIKVSVPVNSAVSAVNKFLEEISRSLPLSEVSLVKIGDKSSNVDLSFYYRPFTFPNGKNNLRISPLSPKALLLIDQLKSFEKTSVFENQPIATSSATK